MTVTTLARRWSAFVRDHIRPEFGSFEWLRVTGMDTEGLPHVHVVWFGPYLPQAWLQNEWGAWTDGDGIAWCAEVKGKGAGVAKYLSKQFVEYLAGQGIRSRWSTSKAWRTVSPGEKGASRLAGQGGLGADSLRFIRSSSYRGHDGPVPAMYRERGELRSSLPLARILEEVRR